MGLRREVACTTLLCWKRSYPARPPPAPAPAACPDHPSARPPLPSQARAAGAASWAAAARRVRPPLQGGQAHPSGRAGVAAWGAGPRGGGGDSSCQPHPLKLSAACFHLIQTALITSWASPPPCRSFPRTWAAPPAASARPCSAAWPLPASRAALAWPGRPRGRWAAAARATKRRRQRRRRRRQRRQLQRRRRRGRSRGTSLLGCWALGQRMWRKARQRMAPAWHRALVRWRPAPAAALCRRRLLMLPWQSARPRAACCWRSSRQLRRLSRQAASRGLSAAPAAPAAPAPAALRASPTAWRRRAAGARRGGLIS